MTGIYMINSLLFVVPCILLLYLAFRDQIKTPRPPIILTAAAVYLLIVLAASRIYLGADTPMKKVLLSGLSQLTGIFIFSAASSYTFSQSFFIITVVKNYSENVLLFPTRFTLWPQAGYRKNLSGQFHISWQPSPWQPFL